MIATIAMSGYYGKEAADLQKEVQDLEMQIRQNEDNKRSAGYLVREGGMVNASCPVWLWKPLPSRGVPG